MSSDAAPAATSGEPDRPGLIKARPVRHPWRWVALAVIAVLGAMMLSSFLTNERWNFPVALEIMNQQPVLEGLWKGTLVGTATVLHTLSTAWQPVTVSYEPVAPGASTLDLNAYVSSAPPGTCFYADDASIGHGN